MADAAPAAPQRVLVIAAHPDDIEFGAGGSIAALVRDGAEVRYLILTRGEKGSDDPHTNSAELAARREGEQRAAAAELGVSAVEFLDERDAEVQPNRQLLGRITRAIRAFRPDVVLAQDPTVLFVNNEWVNHADHRATGAMAVDAVFPTARDPLNFPEHLAEGLQPWKVEELLLWSTNEANHFVDVGDTLERKVSALAHHASQFRDFEATARWVRARAEELGERVGYRAAEGFRRVVLAR